MTRYFVCYYHEIILKRGNRTFFEKRLRKNVQAALKGLPYRAIRRLSGRLVVELLPESPVQQIGARLQKVFGLVFCCPAWRSSQDLSQLEEDLWSLVRERSFETFKIQARRANKKFPLPSPRINERLGTFIRRKSGKTVRLEDPELTCYVDIVQHYAFLYFQRLRGSGGLPVSSSGRVVVLLSGGIDSPVAAYKVMKRGCRAVFVHCHSLPHTTPESVEKVRRLIGLLNAYQYQSKLYLIPFAPLQRRIVAFAPPAIRVILYRRMMIRLAQRVARREGAKALVTGDSIGQVSSQTLDNLQAVSEAVHLPILRPLIGEDKEEIIEVARAIGTFPISILPEVDCCSLFVPRHPETRASLDGIRRVEAEFPVDEMVQEALQQWELEKFVFEGASEPIISGAHG